MIANGELSREAGAYRQAKEQIAQLERELAEFRASSLELEQELEIELEEKEKVELDLRGSVKSLSVEVAQWKVGSLEARF
jgi:predicted  nucleic acid-binding Zn-ribbon protein